MAFLLRRSTTPDGRLVSRRLVKQAESSKLEPAFNPLNSLEFSDYFLLARTSPGLPWLVNKERGRMTSLTTSSARGVYGAWGLRITR